jgi:hypothetical protein
VMALWRTCWIEIGFIDCDCDNDLFIYGMAADIALDVSEGSVDSRVVSLILALIVSFVLRITDNLTYDGVPKCWISCWVRLKDFLLACRSA